jgi:hypothetical protein
LISRLRAGRKNGHSIDFDVPWFKKLNGPTVQNKKALSELRRRPLSSELF